MKTLRRAEEGATKTGLGFTLPEMGSEVLVSGQKVEQGVIKLLWVLQKGEMADPRQYQFTCVRNERSQMVGMLALDHL